MSRLKHILQKRRDAEREYDATGVPIYCMDDGQVDQLCSAAKLREDLHRVKQAEKKEREARNRRRREERRKRRADPFYALRKSAKAENRLSQRQFEEALAKERRKLSRLPQIEGATVPQFMTRETLMALQAASFQITTANQFNRPKPRESHALVEVINEELRRLMRPAWGIQYNERMRTMEIVRRRADTLTNMLRMWMANLGSSDAQGAL